MKGLLQSNSCYWAGFLAISLGLFGPAIWNSRIPSFRDAAHFYYPLEVWLDQCAIQGEFFPDWQPNEGMGVSVPGDTTSALYYPMRAFWLLPGTTVAQRYSLVVLVHLVIAVLGMQYACRRLGFAADSGWVAGICFAFGCPVFFQHNNLVYLCSAAWVGFYLAEVLVLLQSQSEPLRQPRPAVAATSLALMVLAGDPHTAVNAVLIAWILALAGRSAYGIAWISAVALWGVLLSSIQCIPGALWAQHSDRLQTSTYDFSLSPWHLLTFFFPTLGGSYAPIHGRSFALLPAEGRMWIPGLYMGIVPILLVGPTCVAVLGRMRWRMFAKRELRRQATPEDRIVFLLVIGLIFGLLASLGNYSLGWLLKSIGVNTGWPDHWTSLYGWLVEWLPGYNRFRYPAKWTAIACACLAILAGLELHRRDCRSLFRWSLFSKCIVGLSAAGLLSVLILQWLSQSGTAPLPSKFYERWASPDAWLGVPDANRIALLLLIAFGTPLVVILAWQTLGALSRAGNNIGDCREEPTNASLRSSIVWLVLFDVASVAWQWCSFVEPRAAQAVDWRQWDRVWVDQSEANIARDRWDDRSAVSLQEYQEQFLLGKLGLLHQHANLAASVSIEPASIRKLRRQLWQIDTLAENQPELDRRLADLGVHYRLARSTNGTVGRSRFDWHPVSEPRPLCECVDRQGRTVNTSTAEILNWRWTSTDDLQLSVRCGDGALVLIRQFNDGGWVAELAKTKPLAIQSMGDPEWICIELPQGDHRIKVYRSRWPQIVGGLLSFGAAIPLLFVFWPRN